LRERIHPVFSSWPHQLSFIRQNEWAEYYLGHNAAIHLERGSEHLVCFFILGKHFARFSQVCGENRRYTLIFPKRNVAMTPPALLCVDDRPELLQLRKAYLEGLGYSAVTATTASAALSVLENMDVAAVLMDYKSEGMAFRRL
jgi:hypothetical protein